MLGLMAASAVEFCMGEHFYTIGGDIRRQEEGGAIGSDLTGELARVYMLQWDQKFLVKVRIMESNWTCTTDTWMT